MAKGNHLSRVLIRGCLALPGGGWRAKEGWLVPGLKNQDATLIFEQQKTEGLEKPPRKNSEGRRGHGDFSVMGWLSGEDAKVSGKRAHTLWPAQASMAKASWCRLERKCRWQRWFVQ